MSKATMPEPMVEVDKYNNSSELQYTYLSPYGGLSHGTYLITTAQAEAYADARVREALEAAAKICDDRAMKNEAAVSADEPDEASSLRAAAWQMGVCARDIRALIPPTKNEAEE